jgi:CRISPR/Cas system CSM-associated protein Csm3 (group 7 of RAMP superfamily)
MTRYIAHIVVEADTPLKVGSNASDFLQDAPVQKDWNDLPMILGTSIAGVLRKEFDESEANKVFGKDEGSRVIFSNALLLDEKNEVSETLLLDEKNEVNETLLLEKTPFLKIFDNLPIREHTVITDKGVSDNKFDEEIVYKGARFKFSIEVLDDADIFDKILEVLQQTHLRFGGGSTKGFGKFKILEITTQTFTHEDYHHYESSLNHQLEHKKDLKTVSSKEYVTYTLTIKPDDFFMFGSGFGDSDADATPVYEQVVDYENAKLSDKQILVPASSIKGAISHRTTFHYNKLTGNTIENGNGVEVVKEIFGEAKNSKKKVDGSKGKVLFSDCFKEDKKDIKTFDHVAIDRFTGGAIEGALFQEKTIAQKDMWEVEILLDRDVEGDELKAFEKALTDITTGMLPLGGMTTKGHGVFVGEVFKDGKVLSHE